MCCAEPVAAPCTAHGVEARETTTHTLPHRNIITDDFIFVFTDVDYNMNLYNGGNKYTLAENNVQPSQDTRHHSTLLLGMRGEDTHILMFPDEDNDFF